MNILGDMMHFRFFSLGQGYFFLVAKRGMCINGLFCPPLKPKMKVAFHQFYLIDLLEE